MSRLTAFGISLEVPHGWEARAFRHPDGEPTIHVASFPLPRTDGDFGSDAAELMPSDGLLFVLTEYRIAPDDLERGIFAHPKPRTLDPALLDNRTLLRPIRGQRGLQQFFSTAGRAFCLYLVVGSAATHRLPAANSVLAGTVVAPRA